MTDIQTVEPIPLKSIRLWPGMALAVLQCLTWFVLPKLMSDQGVYLFLGTFVGGLAIVVWWVFFSRAPWFERLGAILLMAVALLGTSRLLHVSVAKAGMGMLFIFYAVPLLTIVFVGAVVASSRLPVRLRRVVLVAVILLASGGWTLIRVDGIRAEGGLDFAWRWSPTAEERLLARSNDEPKMLASVTAMTSTPSASGAAGASANWPGFRGPNRDGVVSGVRIETNWSVSPPVELWRHPVGPAWSSFAVCGNLFYTQEQRGDDEIVACYKLATGEPVWMHRDATRFWEANAGPGPRATPALSNGHVYTFGATGILNVLDASSGAVIWSRNVATDSDVKVPYWGFASSPLVIGDKVIVAASGRLVAYDLATGKLLWLGPAHRGSYSSPHLLTIDGIAQVLLQDETGTRSVAPVSGAVLWEHEWPGVGMVQPALTADGEILITTSDMSGGAGMRRIAVAHGSGQWTTQERWTSRGLKPYFNDFVVHNGHAFGFDGSILACIDLKYGQRSWKGGRYGNGQLILLADQDLLLVLSEDGELALVGANPDQFTEHAWFPAIEGKTWNHPVLVGDVLLVRNAKEMAAFRLSPAGH